MDKQYCKVFKSILTSTIWQESKETRLVWITILALKDRFGEVAGSIPGLAAQAGVTLDECKQALSVLQKPDPYSRTKDNEGRRIKEIDGGWLVLNHNKYRKMLGSRAEYFQQYRKNKKSCAQQKGVANVLRNTLATHTDTDRISVPDIPGARPFRKAATPVKTSAASPLDIAALPKQQRDEKGALL